DRREFRHLRVPAAPDQDIDEVDPGGAHAYERLAVLRHRVWDVAEFERPVDLVEEDRSQPVWAGSDANCSRSAILRNLPRLVFGISSTNSNRSGSHHFANCGARNSRRSSAVADAPSFRTTTASGLSPHFSSGTAITADSDTAGWAMSAFSRS